MSFSSCRASRPNEHETKPWELRAAMSLARRWRDQGKPQLARDLLGSGVRVVYGGVRDARSEGGEGGCWRSWHHNGLLDAHE